MKRSTQYFGSLFGLIVLWVGLELARSSFEKNVVLIQLLHLSPIIVILLLGLYCLLKLVFDISTFNDYSIKEIPALEHDILAARDDLKRRGFE